jgi:FAD/FMN-containing dehydrogenase
MLTSPQILYANRHNIPFLAMGSGHGSAGALGNVHDGIQIWTRQLKNIRISADGKTVTVGGGVKVKELTDALWAAGKQTGALILHVSSK